MKLTKLTAVANFLGNFITLLVSLYYFYHTDSAALLYSVFLSISGVICSVLTFLVILQKNKGKNSKFSYGTNRLENFNALVIAVIMFIGLVIAVESAIESIINAQHYLENFITIPITLFVAFSTQFTIFLTAKQGLKYDNSPLLVVLLKDSKLGTIRTFCSMILVMVLWLIHFNDANYQFWLDKMLTFCFGVYGTIVYLSQIYANYKCLSDYPLDEKEQLFILNILSKHFPDYDNIRKIYTTTKGNDFIVEVEIMFPADTPANFIVKLQDQMISEFKQKYKTGTLKLILFDDKKD